MSIRYAVADGNWSSTSTWNGGTLPSSTDDVYANNHTVSINQDITVNSLKKIANTSPAITAGGVFNVTTTASITITAGIAATDNATLSSFLLSLNAGSGAVTINAPGGIFGPLANTYAIEVKSTQTGAVIINGNITAGWNICVFHKATSGSLTVNGNLASISSGGDRAVYMSVGGDVTVNGNLTGGGGAALDAGGATSATIVGNITGGNSGAGLYAGGPATVNITGDITGGTGEVGVSLGLSSGNATIRGNLTPGDNGAGTGYAAVNTYNYDDSQVRISGDVWVGGAGGNTAPHGFFPILGPWVTIAGEDFAIHALDDDGFPSNAGGNEIEIGAGGGGGSPTFPSTGQMWP